MYIKWEQNGYVTVVPKKKVSAYIVNPNGEIIIYVDGMLEENAFIIDLYKGCKEIAEKVMMDAMTTENYVAELPTMENVKEYIDGQNKDN